MAVAFICRLSHIPLCLPVTPTLSTAPLELSHLIQVEMLLPATPDDMADTRCCYLYVPASPTSASNDDENDVEDRKTKDSQEKFYICHRQSLTY